jgi:hypothetical protein
VKDAAWISAELDSQFGPFKSYQRRLVLGELHALNIQNSLAEQVSRVEYGLETAGTAIAQLISWEVGLWFYGGWHDQATWFMARTTKGDARLLASYLALLDELPADQNGDTILGFASLKMQWAVTIQVSRERHWVEIVLRAADDATLRTVAERNATENGGGGE